MRLTHRIATLADVERLSRLMEAATTELQRDILTPEQTQSSHSIMGTDTQLIQDGTYFVVECEGRVAGCGGWSRRATLYGSNVPRGRDPELLDPAVDAARVGAMHTDPAFARRGVGRLILTLCERAAAEEGFTRLELMSTVSGEPLYTAHGFVPVERLTDGRGGADAPLVRMAKAIPAGRRQDVATWHHGVVAQWWAELVEDGPEVGYFRARVEEYGTPALDLACGTGRLLLPMVGAGLDVDGCDVSTDMVSLCRERAEREGFAPRLYVQPMHLLDLPRRYATVFVCGGFGLGGDRDRDQEGLGRIRRHLRPGGTLVMDVHVPYEDAATWQLWLAEGRAGLPQEWGPWPEPRPVRGGVELALLGRVVDLDPVSQVITREVRGRRWRDGRLEADELHGLKERYYFRDEVLMMLEQAGFTDVRVEGDYTSAPPTPETTVLVFIAR